MSNKVSWQFILQDAYTKVAASVQRATEKTASKIKNLSKVTEETDAKVKRSSANLISSFKKVAGAAAVVLGVLSTSAVGSQFQDSLADLSAITGAAGKDLAFLRDESRRLAKASVTDHAEVAEAFKLVASGKSELLKDPKGLSKVTEQVLLLKNATGLDLATATNVAVQSLNQFNAGADQAARFVNVLAAGSKVGASEVNNTGVAIVKAGVAANLTGVSFEQLNGLIQVLAKNGVYGEVAGTGLKTALLKLEASANKKLRPSVVGVTTALENLNKMNLNATRMQRLFGDSAIQVGGVLVKNVALVKQWTKEITGTNIAQEQADARMATFNTKIRYLGIVIKDKLITAFLRLEPVITKMAMRLGGFIDTMDENQINAFIDVLSVLLKIGEAIAAAFTVVIAVFKGVGTAIGEAVGKLSEFDLTALSPLASLLKPDAAATSFKDAFSVGGKLFGLFGDEVKPRAASKTDVNVNLRAPEGTIESIKTKTKGSVPGLNIGVAMGTS